jgi:hypothetical protein
MGDPELDVSGGSGGTYAHCEDIDMLARHSEALGAELAGIVAECHSMLAHPDVLATVPLDADGVARFEGTLLAALDGRDGLGALAIELGAHATALRAAARSYRAADEAHARLIDMIRWAAGDVVATASPLLASGAVGLPALFVAGDAAGVDWERLLTDHPGAVDTLVGMGPGLITGLPGPALATDVPSAARLLARFYPDGTARVEDLGVDTSPVANQPPGGFGDLMDGMCYRDAAASDDDQGQIDVRVLSHPDGSRSYIVDIPGTKDWQPAPLRHHHRLNDLGTNLHVMGGNDTAYQEGIVEALRRAGASATDPVMLVGYSQGGIVAAQTAADLAGSGGFNVTHVVTAGSPVARIDVPDSVQVLSLENRHDIVAHLDAADNPDRTNVVTVSFDAQNGSIWANHGIQAAYLPAAAALDASTDPSVVTYRDSARTFFAREGTTVTSRVYEITRG